MFYSTAIIDENKLPYISKEKGQKRRIYSAAPLTVSMVFNPLYTGFLLQHSCMPPVFLWLNKSSLFSLFF